LESAKSSLQVENTFLKSSIEQMKQQMAEIASLLKKQNGVEEQPEDPENESLATTRARRYKNKQNIQASTSDVSKTNNLDTASQETGGILGRLFGRAPTQNSEIDSEDFCETSSQRSLLQSMGSVNDFGVTQNYWITKIELELLSSPLDQFTSKGTADDAMVDYVRLQRCLNQFNQPINCAMTYDQFLKNSFVAAFDLTTNLQPGLAYAINTVRTGNA